MRRLVDLPCCEKCSASGEDAAMASDVRVPLLPAGFTAAQLPAAYEAAKDALAKCDQVDECKDWADKAAAIASYARQAHDDTFATSGNKNSVSRAKARWRVVDGNS